MAEKKPHGNAGKRNAAKDEDLGATIYTRCTQEEKADCVRALQLSGHKNLQSFSRAALSEYANGIINKSN